MIVKLLTEHHLEFLSLTEGCTGLSEFTLVKLLEISCRSSIVFCAHILVSVTFISGLFKKTASVSIYPQ